MIQKKELPLKEAPVCAFLEDMIPLTVAITKPASYEWIYSNFIQLVYNDPDRFSQQALKFYKLSMLTGYSWDFECPLLIYDKINTDIIRNLNMDIVDVICNLLSNNTYVLTFLDEYYLSYRPQYKKSHYVHENFYYGYDLETQELLGYTYINQSGGYQLDRFRVPFDEVRESFKNTPYDGEKHNRINSICVNKEKFYQFNIKAVRTLLKEYVESINTEERFGDYISHTLNYSFGISVYDGLKKFLFAKKQFAQIIAIQVLMDHKSIMIDRIKYMMENHYIEKDDSLIEWSEKIFDSVKKFKMSYMLYFMSQKESKKSSLCAALDEIKESEIKFYNKLICSIDDFKTRNGYLYSRIGWWYDVPYDIPEVDGNSIKFKLHLINDKVNGFIGITDDVFVKDNDGPIMLQIDSEKEQFTLIVNEKEYPVETKPHSDVSYNVSFAFNGNRLSFHIENNDTQETISDIPLNYEGQLTQLNKIVPMHENSYRFAVEF